MDLKKDFEKLLIDCDKVLTILYHAPEWEMLQKILTDNNIEHDEEHCNKIARQLFSDGLVSTQNTSAGTRIQILPIGIEYISNGGYIGHTKEKEEKEKQDAELKKTTIQYNKSNIKYFKWTVGLTIFNILLVIINLFIAYLGFIKNK